MKGSWQPSEIEIGNIVDIGIVGVQEFLTDRRVKDNQVTHQLLKVQKTQKNILDISTIERDRYIISNIGTKTPTELAQKLNVSQIVIYDTCKNYGVEISPVCKYLEKKTTKNVYFSGEDEGVQALLPHITVYVRTHSLGIKKARQKSKIADMSIEGRSKYILANIDTKTLDELAEELKVSVDTVFDICTREVSIELYRRKKVRWKDRHKAKRKASTTFG